MLLIFLESKKFLNFIKFNLSFSSPPVSPNLEYQLLLMETIKIFFWSYFVNSYFFCYTI